MKETGLTGKRRSTTIAATPDDGKSQRKRRDRRILVSLTLKCPIGCLYMIAQHQYSQRPVIDAFELWCWRRVLSVSWVERKTNISIIENIKPEWTLESRVAKAALS